MQASCHAKTWNKPKPTQRVRVVGPDGRPVIAYYPMRRLPDGTWRIDGCYLQAPQPHQA